MGLDQYLYRQRYIEHWDHIPPEKQQVVTLTKGGIDVPLDCPSYIIEKVGYWRKANAIHRWFVQNVQGGVDNCQKAYVEVDQLRKLLKLVNKVLKDHSKAGELLPTQSGFFFGSTEFDEWYFEDLKTTKEIIEKVIAFENAAKDWSETGDYYYEASW